MLFLQYFMMNLVLTKSSGPKCHTVAFTAPIFAGFCVYHTDLSGGGGDSWDRPAQQSECPFTAKMHPFIHQLSVSQTSERFLPEVKNAAFCI
jgi:hypothetical protein